MKKIIIINKTNSSDSVIFKSLDMYYDLGRDKIFVFNNKLFTIEKKTTMLKTKIIIKWYELHNRNI